MGWYVARISPIRCKQATKTKMRGRYQVQGRIRGRTQMVAQNSGNKPYIQVQHAGVHTSPTRRSTCRLHNRTCMYSLRFKKLEKCKLETADRIPASGIRVCCLSHTKGKTKSATI